MPSAQPEFFEYDPEAEEKNEEKVAEKSIETSMPVAKRAGSNPTLAREVFGGKLFSRDPLEQGDAEGYVRVTSATRPAYTHFQKTAEEFESPIERFNRLKREIALFQSDLKELASQDSISAVSSGSLSQSLEATESDLGLVLSDPRVAPFLASETPLGGAALNPQRRNLASTLLSEVQGAAGSTQGKTEVKAELFLHSGEGTGSRLADLDRRIARLQKRVGNQGSPLRQDVEDIHGKLELFDSHRLDSLTTRIKSLLTELEIAESQKRNQAAGNPVSAERINKLDEMMTRLDPVAQEVPGLVASLTSQKDLHEKSASVILRLQAFEKQHISLQKVLEHDKASLKQAMESFANNLKIMATNVAAFENRFKALEAKGK